MKFLITGGCGFIGRAFASHLLAGSGHGVRVLDNLSGGSIADLEQVGNVTHLVDDSDFSDWTAPLALHVGDILDPGAIGRALSGADIVIHLAANTGVPQSVADPMQDCRTNVLGTLNMLEGSRAAGIGRFVFASSGAPLGVQTPPLNEEMAPRPASPYGASKLAGEGYCSAYYQCYGLETVALRFGNVYGEGSGKKGSVVAKFIKQALAGERLEIYGDGSQTRDFIHISDLVQAIHRASVVPGIGGEVFQIASASETTVAEITDALLDVLQSEGVPRPGVFNGATRNGDVARNFSDTSKARRMLDWTPAVALEAGLKRTVRFFLENRQNT